MILEKVFDVPPIDQAEPENEGPDADEEDTFDILKDEDEEPSSPPKKQDSQ